MDMKVKIQKIKTMAELNDFQLGEQYMLQRIQKLWWNNDPHQFFSKVGRLIIKESINESLQKVQRRKEVV